jgi:Flp pilus assembly protein TadD
MTAPAHECKPKVEKWKRTRTGRQKPLVCLPSWPFAWCLGVLLWGGCSQPQTSVSQPGSRFHQREAAAEAPRDQPPTAKTLYSMAQILATQGKDAQCEFVLRRCVQEYPQFTPAYNSLAELQMRQGRIHEAIEALSAALEIRPQDPILLNNRGMCLLLRKEYTQALAHFTEAAGRVPEREKYRANMAAALGLLGRQEECLALLQQVLPGEKAEHNAQVLRQAYDQTAERQT